MSVSLVEIKLESPTLLVQRVGRTGFSSIVGWIPGSALRGSIITWSVRSGHLNEEVYAREMSSPTLIVHPAYPVDGETTRPPTPYTLSCKIDKLVIDVLGRDRIKNLTLAKDIKTFVDLMGDPSLYCIKSQGIPNSTKRINIPVIPSKGVIVRKYSPPNGEQVDVLTSVAINKTIRAAEKGMLFNYEVLLPDQKFRTLVIDRSENRDFIEYLRSEGLLFLGRGTSRGLGRVKVRIIKTWELEVLAKGLEHQVEKWLVESDGGIRVALYARSPITQMRGWGVSSPLPKLDLSWIGEEVNLGLAIGTDNRVLAVGGRTKFLSVSYPTGLPRPSFSCSDRGSIFIMESKDSRSKVSRAISLGSILGWDRLAVLGLNFLQPLGWWYDDPIYS